MEKEIKQLITSIGGVLKGGKGTPFWMRATRAWFFILLFGTGVVFTLCGVGVYEFFSNRFSPQEEGAGGVPAIQGVLTKEYVEQVMKVYEERKDEYVSVRDGILDTPQTGGKTGGYIQEEVEVSSASSTEQVVVEEDVTPRM